MKVWGVNLQFMFWVIISCSSASESLHCWDLTNKSTRLLILQETSPNDRSGKTFASHLFAHAFVFFSSSVLSEPAVLVQSVTAEAFVDLFLPVTRGMTVHHSTATCPGSGSFSCSLRSWFFPLGLRGEFQPPDTNHSSPSVSEWCIQLLSLVSPQGQPASCCRVTLIAALVFCIERRPEADDRQTPMATASRCNYRLGTFCRSSSDLWNSWFQFPVSRHRWQVSHLPLNCKVSPLDAPWTSLWGKKNSFKIF